jgi:aminoglycoside 6'-N-acetyltransferase
VLERAGFQRVAIGHMTPDNPTDTTDHFIYRLERP